MNEHLPEWLVLCIWRALLGEIYPSIRAIAATLSKEKKLLIRYYLDNPPTEMDYESMEVVATNISASMGLDAVAHIDLECQYATAPLGEIDPLAGFVYCRREYDM